MGMKKLFALFAAAAFFLVGCGGEVSPADSSSFPESVSESASDLKEEVKTLSFGNGRRDDYINWYGRCYADESAALVHFSNASAGFEVSFEGTTLVASIVSDGSAFPREASGNAWIYVFADGAKNYSRAVRKELGGGNEKRDYVLLSGLPEGRHTAKVLKCTEAKYGTAALFSLSTDGTFLSPPERAQRRAEIIGDSIMSGSESMRESSTTDSKLSESENSLSSYGYIAADMLDAEVNAISRSGALVSGYRGYASIPDYYEKYGQTEAENAAWDFSSYRPDFIILDLGTNDSLIAAPKELISEKYLSFLRLIREKNPGSAIFCCAGAMITSVNAVVEEAVETRNREGDEKIWFYALPAMSKGGHPKEETHLENGYGLGAFIMQTLDWVPEL